MRVLLTAAPLSGHFFPLVPLGWACRAAGHEVLVVTSNGFVDTALRSGLPATSAGPGLDLSELANPDVAHGIADARHAHGVAFGRTASRSLAGMLSIVDSWRPDVVVSERAEFAGPVAAASRDVPRVEFHWGVPPLAEYRAGAEVALREHLDRLGLAGLPDPDLTLNPWPPRLRMPHARGHAGVRHVPYNGVAHVPDWLFEPARPPRVCLTLGTVLPQLGTAGVTGILRTVVAELAGLGGELIVAVDDDVAAGLGPLPPEVRHAGRVPLAELLPGCALLVHHGGHGTALTALAAGRPQVVLPAFDDQFENAGAVAGSGAGLVLPLAEAEPPRVANFCRRVLDDPAFAESAERVAEEISAQPSLFEVVDLLGRLAGTPYMIREQVGNSLS